MPITLKIEQTHKKKYYDEKKTQLSTAKIFASATDGIYIYTYIYISAFGSKCYE